MEYLLQYDALEIRLEVDLNEKRHHGTGGLQVDLNEKRHYGTGGHDSMDPL